MQRLINAHELWAHIYKLSHKHRWKNRTNIAFNKCLDAIQFFPTVDAEPVRYGRWQVNEVNGYKDMTCLSCGWLFEYYDGLDEEWNYCPHCGAKMAECEAVLRWPRREDETD